MSRSEANCLLQYLVGELNKLWSGKPSQIKESTQAYALCRQIAEAGETKKCPTNTKQEHTYKED